MSLTKLSFRFSKQRRKQRKNSLDLELNLVKLSFATQKTL